MGKVLFIMKYPLTEQYSIKQKLNGEMQAVINMGNEVSYISFDKEYLYLNTNNKTEIIKKTTFGNSKLYFHLFAFYDIYKAAYKVLCKQEFDVVYFRFSPLNYFGFRFCKKAGVVADLVVEIPTFPTGREKPKNIARRVYSSWSQYWWKRSAKYVKLFALIGEQANSYLNVPAININNGIMVDSIPQKNNCNDDGKIHMLALASMSNWHGYDRLIRGMAECKDEYIKNYILDMVGDEGDGSLEKWKKLVNDLHMERQIVFHGKMTGETLTNMFDRATIGIASLGLYRNGFYSGSVLKLREYMARGLPFVYAHDDPDLNNDMPWCIKIPNDDTPVSMEVVNEFVSRIKNNRVSNEMRQYAINNMSWETQFRKIFERL